MLLTGHLSEEVEARVQELSALLPRRCGSSFRERPARAGTGGAVFHARDVSTERFLLCNGDSLFDCNLARCCRRRATDADAGRMLLRRWTMRRVTASWRWRRPGDGIQ